MAPSLSFSLNTYYILENTTLYYYNYDHNHGLYIILLPILILKTFFNYNFLRHLSWRTRITHITAGNILYGRYACAESSQVEGRRVSVHNIVHNIII